MPDLVMRIFHHVTIFHTFMRLNMQMLIGSTRASIPVKKRTWQDTLARKYAMRANLDAAKAIELVGAPMGPHGPPVGNHRYCRPRISKKWQRPIFNDSDIYYTSILTLIWYSYLKKKTFDGSLYMLISYLIVHNGGILNVQGYMDIYIMVGSHISG